MTTSDVHWHIQDARLPEWENLQRAIYLIQEMGMTAHVRPYVPFGGMDYSFLPEDRPVVALGALAVAKDHQRRGMPHRPFAWFDQERLRCSHYFPRYRDALVSRDHAFIRYGEMLERWEGLFDALGVEGRLFLKPDDNDKAFDGAVVKADMKEAWKVMAEMRGEPDADLLCVAARPVEIRVEWRLFVARKKVVAGSKYRENGMLCKEAGYPAEAAALAERLASSWEPQPVVCYDIGLTAEGYRLIEIGSPNCAGFYLSDLRPIIAAMAEVAAAGW